MKEGGGSVGLAQLIDVLNLKISITRYLNISISQNSRIYLSISKSQNLEISKSQNFQFILISHYLEF